MKRGTGAWGVVRWIIVGVLLDRSFWWFFETARMAPGPQGIPFELWYGEWRVVVIVSALYVFFLLGLCQPRRPVEWRNSGLYMAFLISLFTEMFGLPLTIYLLAPLLGLRPSAFGLHESHLWAFFLDRLGVIPLQYGVYVVTVAGTGLVALGVGLVAIGWATVYRGRGELVTGGIYAYLRHPQYLGLILIVLGFTIQWPTLPTLLMAPALTVIYIRLARREDRELATSFGRAFLDYAAQTPAFLPWGSRMPEQVEARPPGGGGP